MQQIEKIENDLASQIKKFNRVVAKYNALIHSFSLVIFRKAAKLSNYDIEADPFVHEAAPAADTTR